MNVIVDAGHTMFGFMVFGSHTMVGFMVFAAKNMDFAIRMFALKKSRSFFALWK